MHIVDEDLKTVILHGGEWLPGNMGGITCRLMQHVPIYTYDTVASYV